MHAEEIEQKREDKHDEYVKVIGLEPEKLMKSLEKYKVVVEKLPTFSNIFDAYESFIPGLGGQNLVQNAIPGQSLAQSTITGQVSAFAR